jgi:uncharacterized protein (UPF0248 family)
MRWQKEAMERIKKAPIFVRPFIKMRLEAKAKERGLEEITVELIDEIKENEHKVG